MEDKKTLTGIPGLQVIPRFLLWLGGSAGVIGVVLTTFGFLVEHAHFDRLGIPRSIYSATPNEYLVTGGKFLLGIVPLTLAGFLEFCLDYWWLALAVLLLGVVMWWRKGSANLRWLLAAVCLTIAVCLLALRFQKHDAPDHQGVAMFTFVVIAALVFVYVEVAFANTGATDQDPPASMRSKYASRAPFILVLPCALIALPYLRGYYALERDYPVVQFLGKDKGFFCDLAGNPATSKQVGCEGEAWQVIDISIERAILRRVEDSRIYIVPASSLTTFRIVGQEQKP